MRRAEMSWSMLATWILFSVLVLIILFIVVRRFF